MDRGYAMRCLKDLHGLQMRSAPDINTLEPDCMGNRQLPKPGNGNCRHGGTVSAPCTVGRTRRLEARCAECD